MEIVFDGDRNAIEPGMSLAARTALITLFRSGKSAGAIKGDETIQTRIKCIDALERALDESHG